MASGVILAATLGVLAGWQGQKLLCRTPNRTLAETLAAAAFLSLVEVHDYIANKDDMEGESVAYVAMTDRQEQLRIEVWSSLDVPKNKKVTLSFSGNDLVVVKSATDLSRRLKHLLRQARLSPLVDEESRSWLVQKLDELAP